MMWMNAVVKVLDQHPWRAKEMVNIPGSVYVLRKAKSHKTSLKMLESDFGRSEMETASM